MPKETNGYKPVQAGDEKFKNSNPGGKYDYDPGLGGPQNADKGNPKMRG